MFHSLLLVLQFIVLFPCQGVRIGPKELQDGASAGGLKSVDSDTDPSPNKTEAMHAVCVSLAMSVAMLAPIPIPGSGLPSEIIFAACCPKWLIEQAKDIAAKGKLFAMDKTHRELAEAAMIEDMKAKLTPAELKSYQAEQERKELAKKYDSERNTSRMMELEREYPWLVYSKLVELVRLWPLNVPVPDCRMRILNVVVDLQNKYQWLPDIPCTAGDRWPLPAQFCRPNAETEATTFCEKAGPKIDVAAKMLIAKFERRTLHRDDAILYRNRYCPDKEKRARVLTPLFESSRIAKVDGAMQKCCCPRPSEREESYCKLISPYTSKKCVQRHDTGGVGLLHKAASAIRNAFGSHDCKCAVGPGWQSAKKSIFRECIVQRGNEYADAFESLY